MPVSPYVVGQTVCIVRPGRQGYGKSATTEDATITHVGRTWATLSTRDKFDMTSGKIGGPGSDIGYGNGYVVMDRATWAREVIREGTWRELQAKFRESYSIPANVEVEHIAAAAKVLGWTLPSLAPKAEAPTDA